jgi:hypothetical protein
MKCKLHHRLTPQQQAHRRNMGMRIAFQQVSPQRNSF